MRNLKIYFYYKNLYYIIVLIFMIIAVFVGWYIFFSMDIFVVNDKRIIGIISYYGLTFGVFQFFINQINNKSKRYFELRLSAYKEIIKIIESITQAVNEKLGTFDKFDFHDYGIKLMNLISEYTVFGMTNLDYLFPGTSKLKESQDITELLYSILRTTDKIRKQIDDSKDDESIRIEWHNDIRLKLKVLHEKKYIYYKQLRKFL